MLLFSLLSSVLLLLASNRWIGLSIKHWYNPLVFINIFHLVIHTLLGAIWIVLGFANNSVVHKISDTTVKSWSYYIIYSVLVFLAVLLISHKFDGKRRGDWKKWYEDSVKIGENESVFYGLLVLLLLTCFLSVIYVTFVSGFSFLRISDAVSFRYAVSRNFQGVIYIKTILFDTLTPLLSVILYSYWLHKRSWLKLFAFLFSFLLAFYSTTYSFAKSPFFILLLTLIIVNITYNGVTRVVKFLFAISMLIMVSFFVFLSGAGDDVQFVINRIVERIVVDEVAGSYLMYEIFPLKYDPIGFRSLTSLVELVGFEHSEPAARIAMKHAFGERAQSSMNLLSTYYLGEAWANFGFWGVFFSPIYVSSVIIFSVRYLKSLGKSPFTIALMSYMVIPSSITSQFNNFILNPTLMTIGVVLLVFRSVKVKSELCK